MSPSVGQTQEILQRGLKVKEYELRRKNFSETGTGFGFGIQEHVDLCARYDLGIGIFGMDFYVVMGRPGIRVSRRKERCSSVGGPHRVNKDDTMAWFKQRFDGIILISECSFICTSKVDATLRNITLYVCFVLHNYSYVQLHAFLQNAEPSLCSK